MDIDNDEAKAYAKALGTAIRKRRKALGFAQDKFAIEHGITRSYYSDIERGETNVTIAYLRMLAKHLKIDLLTLLKDVEAQED